MHDIQDIGEQKIAVSEIRFGGVSVFGLMKPFRFFDLPAIHMKPTQK